MVRLAKRLAVLAVAGTIDSNIFDRMRNNKYR